MSDRVLAPDIVDPLVADDTQAERTTGLWRDTLRSILRQRSAVVGLIILGFLVFTAVFAPLIATHDPDGRLLGVEAGRQAASRAVHPPARLSRPTSRSTCSGPTATSATSSAGSCSGRARRSSSGWRRSASRSSSGSTIGALAGYMSGWVDNTFMRFMDVILAFPSLLLAIAIVTAAGPSLVNALLAIGIVAIPIYARVARASVLSAKENDYVTASRALGESTWGVLTRRIMPNSITPIVVAGTLGIGAPCSRSRRSRSSA